MKHVQLYRYISRKHHEQPKYDNRHQNINYQQLLVDNTKRLYSIRCKERHKTLPVIFMQNKQPTLNRI